MSSCPTCKDENTLLYNKITHRYECSSCGIRAIYHEGEFIEINNFMHNIGFIDSVWLNPRNRNQYIAEYYATLV